MQILALRVADGLAAATPPQGVLAFRPHPGTAEPEFTVNGIFYGLGGR